MTINCPNCSHKEQDGILLCSNCGTILAKIDGINTAPIPSSQLGGRVTGDIKDREGLPKDQPVEAVLSFHILSSGHILPFLGEGEFIVGRVSAGQSILPDLDLEPYKAYESGVSRLHARVRVITAGAFITDLGSSNGTRINGKDIAPHTEQPILHQDIIQLGQLSIQAIVREPL